MPGPVSQSNPGPGSTYALTCAFCGFTYNDPDNHSEELRAHILECADHPVSKLRGALTQIQDLTQKSRSAGYDATLLVRIAAICSSTL
jgi:hypothetical protein